MNDLCHVPFSPSGPMDSSSLRQLPPADRLLHPGVPAGRADWLRPRLQHYPKGASCFSCVYVMNPSRFCPSCHPWSHFSIVSQHINELTMKLDLQSVLRGAEAIYLQLVQCKVGGASRCDLCVFVKMGKMR